jgi:hypothetical protein
VNIWLVSAAVAVIVVLAAYAAYLHWLLYRQRRAQKERAEGGVLSSPVGVVDPAGRQQLLASRNRSLYLLADAILDDKLSHTEGCLRICAIASGLEDQERFRMEYGVLFRVAEATAHIPILGAWKALPGEDKKRFDKERMAVEAKYNEAVVEAAKRIKAHYPL